MLKLFSGKKQHRNDGFDMNTGMDYGAGYGMVDSAAKTRLIPGRAHAGSDNSSRSPGALSDQDRVTRFFQMQDAVAPSIVNVALLIDRSGSVDKNDLRYIYGLWFRRMVQTYCKKGTENGLRYNMAVVAFNDAQKLLLPFTFVDQITVRELEYLPPHGYTHMEEAVNFTCDLIEAEKAKQDAQRAMGKKIERAGSLLIMTTDGQNEYSSGPRPLSPEFVERMARLNNERHVTTLAFRFGCGPDECIAQIAPGKTLYFKDGRSYENPHAFVFDRNKAGYEDGGARAIELLMNVIEQASSSSCAIDGAYSAEPIFLPHGSNTLDGVVGDVVSLPSYIAPARKPL